MQTLSLATESLLSELFVALCDGERDAEILRQRLAEKLDFEPYAAFKRLDRLSLSHIASLDLQNFLRDNSIFATEKECLGVLRYFDTTELGRLSYSDFLTVVLPCENPALRSIATSRLTYHVGPRDFLPYDVEIALARLFEREVELYRKVEYIKGNLQARYDYSPSRLYDAIDYLRLSKIDDHSLRSFLRKTGIIPLEDDLLRIIRRIDTNTDNEISYSDFSDLLKPADPEYSSGLGSRSIARLTSSPGQRGSPLRNKSMSPSRAEYMYSKMKVEDEIERRETIAALSKSPARGLHRSGSPLRRKSAERISSPLRSSAANRISPSKNASFASPLRSHSPLASRQLDYISPARSTYKSPARSILKTSELNGSSPNRSLLKSPMRVDEEDQLVRAIKDQINLEREVEEVKTRLARCSDFNLLDGYKILDPEGRGSVSSSEVREALADIGVFPTSEELFLFMRRYDKDSDGRLRYSDFCEIFTPRDIDSAALLNNRSPFYSNHNLPRNEYFSASTRAQLKEAWRRHFEVEASAESLRQSLKRRPLFSVHEAFQTCDQTGKGYITINEFRKLLESHGFFATDPELLSLMDRYDRNRDGRVSYAEFVEEVTPKSPQKHY